ncbi:MAG: methyltransferase domain-containing protein [Anaerolineae bacterium]|nr:methyltransferase domain-containing protein [Anaerolineae bacterium]
MHDFLLDMLQCPACYGALSWKLDEQRADRIEEAEALCTVCGATYPVREGIGLFLTPDLPRADLWEQTDSALMRYLRAHSGVKRALMNVALHSLAPADQFFRALVLEELGKFAQAKAAVDLALPGIYSEAYLACVVGQFEHIAGRLTGSVDPIIDLASGRGALAEFLARRLPAPVVVTDFSPRILRRDRRWFEFLGLSNRISLLAFDARRTPFKDGAVTTLTTNQGLANIQQPGDLLKELRRVVGGVFLAVAQFYPEGDEANAAALRAHGLDALLFHSSAPAQFEAAGWEVEFANRCAVDAAPTSPGDVLPDVQIDAFPVAETTLEFCMLAAR